MFLIKSQYYQNDNNSSKKDEVYIDVDDDLVDIPQQAPINHLLRCDKYFTSPLSQSQINYECTAPIARNTPENNKCKLIDYRNTKLASFCVDSKLLICLPQAFELFLKNLVGGLHTVYTKLKRLDIVPIVCNVEQVRILRGLGAIQPGVNRCKLIAPSEFDTLYDDCTNSGSRPGRPPKRVQTNQHHHHHHHESTESSSSSDSSEESSTNKKICLDTEGSLSHHHHHQTVNQLALVYYNNLINYQHQLMQKNEENSCKNLIKDFTVKVNKDDLNLSNSSSSPASSSSFSSSSINTSTLASELILKNKKSNPLSIENLISKKEQDVEDADERRQTELEEEIVDVDEIKITSNHNIINNNNSGSLVFINQQLNQRIDYLTRNILCMESNLKQMKQSLENSLMNERNMRIKYEAKIKNLIKLKRLLIAKTKKSQNLRFLKNSKSKYFRLCKKSMKMKK